VDNVKLIVNKLVINLFNSVFPPVCYACNIRINIQDDCLCHECLKRLKRHKEILIGTFIELDMDFYQAVCLYQYDYMVHNLIHDFKYKNLKKIGNFFAKKALEIIKSDYPNYLNVDCVVGVPMHCTKLRERHFNQSHYLSDIIAKGLNVPNLSSSIKQTIPTPKQSRLKLSDRLSKPENIYKKNGSENFQNKKVLLIDDVFTTGTTVNGLSKFLLGIGAERVYVMAIATSGNDEL